jgi:hypothetical protein
MVGDWVGSGRLTRKAMGDASLRSRPPIMRFEPAIFPHNQVRYAMKNRDSTAAPLGGISAGV